MVNLRKVFFVIYKVCFQKIFWLLITVCDIIINPPLWAFWTLKSKKLLPPITEDLLLKSATSLATKIRHKTVTSEAVVTTFINRIKEVNPILNAVVQDRFSIAIEEAKRVDRIIASDAYTTDELAEMYPLFGIPITVKEAISVSGMSHSGGMISSRPKATVDADVIQKIKDAGAIIVAVTNTPELSLDWECYNNVTGTTSNPYDNRRTSGASSGGEAALIGSAASVIGIGSDALGSLRLPTHFCGIFAHKPTGGMVSIEGHYPMGVEEVYKKSICVGPMARYSTDLPLLMNIICKNEYKKCLDLHRKVDFSKLSIYYIENWDSNLTHRVAPDILQKLHKTLDYFHKTYKTKIEKWQNPDLGKAADWSLISLLKMKAVDDIFDKDPTKSAVLELLKYFVGLSKHTLYPICYLLLARYLPVYNLEKIRSKLQTAERSISNMLGENGVLICPPYPIVAPFHRGLFTKGYNAVFMSTFNSIGHPVTLATVGISSNGLPIGMQIVGKPYSDRITMAVAEEIERAFGGWKVP